MALWDAACPMPAGPLPLTNPPADTETQLAATIVGLIRAAHAPLILIGYGNPALSPGRQGCRSDRQARGALGLSAARQIDAALGVSVPAQGCRSPHFTSRKDPRPRLMR